VPVRAINGDGTVELGGPLTIDDVVAIAGGAPARFAAGVAERVAASRSVVERAVESGEVVYGVTTGFGSLADVRLSAEHTSALQHGLIRSHAVAVGNALPPEEVRAMLALRAHMLGLGYSGVRWGVANRFIELLNFGILPVVPEQGSLGASGDLAPLAHLALGAVGEGEVTVAGERTRAGEALATAGLAPLRLEAKEGLALINGTQGMTAIGVLSAARARRLAKMADIAAALTIEAILGTDRAFDLRVVGLRPHPGQQVVARNLLRLLSGSEILASHRESDHIVQDAYSIRCAPQVHGAFRDVLANTVRTLEIELESVSDNPIVTNDGEIPRAATFTASPSATPATLSPQPPSASPQSPSAGSTASSTRRPRTGCPRSWSARPV
jgi:histidine ammonia-lyase